MTPRLKELYLKEIQPALKTQFGFKNLNMVKKHVKTTKEKKGGIISKENFIHISNLELINKNEKNKKTEAKK